jgi:Nif-specific regulatory protein
MAPHRSPPAVSTGDEHTPDWRALELLLMREVMKLVGQSLSPAHVLREMLHLMSELVGLNRGRVVLVDAPEAGSAGTQVATHTASIHHSYGLTRTEAARGTYARGEGITGKVLATGLPAIVQDVDAEPLFLFRAVKREQLPVETVAFLALPIAVNGATVGVLACHRIRSRQRHLTDDMALLRVLATLAGQVLQLEQLVAAADTAAGRPQRHPVACAGHPCGTLRPHRSIGRIAARLGRAGTGIGIASHGAAAG